MLGIQHLLPEVRVEIYGFEVSNHNAQLEGFFPLTRNRLNAIAPGVPWDESACDSSTAPHLGRLTILISIS